VEERTALETFGTWRLEKPPPNVNIVGCRWTFVMKHDASDAIARYRARLIAQGFSQVPGVDFFETYAPVAKMASMCLLLAMSARLDLEIHQIDIKSAYLNGEFKEGEIIYMRLPPGIHLTDDKSLVYRLLKPLYGLHQSGRHWY
jgi:Reverse transcriptase (RNA-dependent DNA polymerase)